eukprot:7036720-Pyramimonas_sp.AAC.1
MDTSCRYGELGRVQSHDGPIRHRKCGYILMMDQSDAPSSMGAPPPHRAEASRGEPGAHAGGGVPAVHLRHVMLMSRSS